MRLRRLTAAANDAIAAAGDGDSSQLRRYLHRFEVLTSAIWTVQLAVSDPDRGRRESLGPAGEGCSAVRLR